VQHIKNINEYGRVAATQASEKVEQNITWYILYSGERFNWPSKWAPSFRKSSEMYSATWYRNPKEHNMKLE
jgi:hypothetical protein